MVELILYGSLFFYGINKEGIYSVFLRNPQTIEVSNTPQADLSKDVKKRIAITFDDGPNLECTEELLEGLKRRNVKATFFVLGENVRKYPGILRKIYKDGHLIANHSYSHVQMSKISETEAKKELLKTDQLIYALTEEHTSYFRPPYGDYKKELEQKIPYIIVCWTMDPLDWKDHNAKEIQKKVVTGVKENDIILLHDCYHSSVQAALGIVDALKEEGYEFVTINELMID